jgi:hypothetical protein
MQASVIRAIAMFVEFMATNSDLSSLVALRLAQ